MLPADVSISLPPATAPGRSVAQTDRPSTDQGADPQAFSALIGTLRVMPVEVKPETDQSAEAADAAPAAAIPVLIDAVMPAAPGTMTGNSLPLADDDAPLGARTIAALSMTVKEAVAAQTGAAPPERPAPRDALATTRKTTRKPVTSLPVRILASIDAGAEREAQPHRTVDVFEALPVGKAASGLIQTPGAPVAGLGAESAAMAQGNHAGATRPVIADAVNSPQWGQAFAHHVTVMVRQGVQSVSLHLTPPALGRVDVQVSIHRDDAAISFAVQHDAAREAVQAAIPRLRDMLGDNGINLADVAVGGQGTSPDQHASPGHDPVRAPLAGIVSDPLADESLPIITVRAVGLIDQYV